MGNKNILILSLAFVLALSLVSIVIAADASNCFQDTWTCSDWSSCSKVQTRTRDCTMTFDCPGVKTPKPATTGSCKYVSSTVNSLKCLDLNTTKERIACRLGLTQFDISNGLQIAYLPEECSQADKGDEKDACVRLYSESQNCWHLDMGVRNSCIKEMFNITDIIAMKNSCKTGADFNSTCYASLKKSVYGLVKLKIYELEERAKVMMDNGLITRDQAADITEQLEKDIISFNNANDKAGRIKALNDAKSQWAAFITEVRK